MANVSSLDVGVLFIIVVTASLANGSSSSKDVSHRGEVVGVEEVKCGMSLPGGAGADTVVASCDEAKKKLSFDLEPPPPPPQEKTRAKRCTCYTYKDKECVYYCHLDIIWINTPEHTVPYGMSSYQGSLRMRRSTETDRQRRTRRRRRRGAEAQRCVCSLQNDSGCSSFCTDSRRRRPPPAELKIEKRTTTLLSEMNI